MTETTTVTPQASKWELRYSLRVAYETPPTVAQLLDERALMLSLLYQAMEERNNEYETLAAARTHFHEVSERTPEDAATLDHAIDAARLSDASVVIHLDDLMDIDDELAAMGDVSPPAIRKVENAPPHQLTLVAETPEPSTTD